MGGCVQRVVRNGMSDIRYHIKMTVVAQHQMLGQRDSNQAGHDNLISSFALLRQKVNFAQPHVYTETRANALQTFPRTQTQTCKRTCGK